MNQGKSRFLRYHMNQLRPRFLMVPNPEQKEVYILHRHFPACLIKVINTNPISLIIDEMYQELEEGSILQYTFLDDAKVFLRRYTEKLNAQEKAVA